MSSPASPAPPAGRYEIRERESRRFLTCREAPGIFVTVHASHAYAEADARKLGERVILLDGAGQFGPVVDSVRQLYNLDHHEGCVRAFTLATCEQALMLVVRGLELDRGDWTIYANQPDLDTVLAIWVLLNYRRVRTLSLGARDVLMPLLRLEGCIDAHGHETTPFCGLPDAVLRDTATAVDHLMARLLAANQVEPGGTPDLLEVTRRVLCEVDALVLTEEELDEVPSIEEVFGHVSIGGNHVAIACRDDRGIYAVESGLRKIWEDRLGIIALLHQNHRYTLRRSAAFSGIDLRPAYSRLNLIDRAVDGRPPNDRWGGSEEIGGSPRGKASALEPDAVLDTLEKVYARRRRRPLLKDAAAATLWTTGIVLLCAAIAEIVSFSLYGLTPIGYRGPRAFAIFCAALAVSACVAIFWGRRPWVFGWRLPAGLDWLIATPVVGLAALAGGVWLPTSEIDAGGGQAAALAWGIRIGVAGVAALAAELWFRGVAHGYCIFDAEVQRVGGRWILSRPTLLSALLYAGATQFLAGVWLSAAPLRIAGSAGIAVSLGAALVVGVALAVVRERSLSLWPCVVTHLAGMGVAALALGL